MVTITGTNNDETLIGTGGADIIEGLGGNDTLYGMGADDVMRGGTGDDTMFVDSAGDSVAELAGEGNDVVASSVSWTLTAGASVELLTTGWIDGTTIVNLIGNELSQHIWGNNAGNGLTGGGGDDTLFGFGGNDSLVGGEGNDVMFGGAGDDQLRGGRDDDTYFLDDPGDKIVEAFGEGAHDVAAAGFDYHMVGGQVELLTTGWIGGTATIALSSDGQHNEIWGNNGINALGGGSGNDALFGFGGDDRLDGGKDADMLFGGSGQDVFVFGIDASTGAQSDDIFDFDVADDTIELDDGKFGALPAGALSAGSFVLGTAAADADDHIIYDSATGDVFYDFDGTGSTAAVLLFSVTPGTALTAADFIVV
ncbi:MAG TPA: calcium-binding protein [Allosphingosinicella sp.]|nr:calcium-binding protein [Allosphingosinicella sp.]